MTAYYEVVCVCPYRTFVYTNINEAAKMGRYLAQETGHEVLLREVRDIAYLDAEKAESIAVDWRSVNAVTKAYKVH